uniref:Nuclear receptor domain-containing protein n=1 Tax=Mesocestoides corti TaxID=53468 RepID=A0A5K3FUE8_MESCO
MDVTGTDPRARTGLFLWPWAATGYPNMPSSNAGPINPQSTPPLGLSSPPMSGGGGFEQGLQHQQQQQDTSLESFYSRLPYSAGGPVPSLQQMQQHQRQQREAAAAAAAVAVSEMQGINNQSGVNRMSATGQHQPPHAPPLAPPPPPPPPPPPFDQRTLMNGRQQQQQQPPTINSASSSPLNSGAYHNPPISPGAQQQQVSQQQFQRHYSSTGSLQNASSSPLDGRISSSASPSVSSAPSYCLKRPSNEFNSATAMALALQAVAKGDRQMQPPPPMHVPPSSSVAEHLQGGGGPGGGDVFASMNSNYLFQPSMSKGPGGGLHGRGSTEAAAMAAAMAAQAARDAANEMVVDPRSAAAGGHPLGLHAGGFLPDFLSGETKLDPTGGVGLRGGFGSVDGTPTMGGGLGMMDGLPGIYGHAAKGYKCKICQHGALYYELLETGRQTVTAEHYSRKLNKPSEELAKKRPFTWQGSRRVILLLLPLHDNARPSHVGMGMFTRLGPIRLSLVAVNVARRSSEENTASSTMKDGILPLPWRYITTTTTTPSAAAALGIPHGLPPNERALEKD